VGVELWEGIGIAKQESVALTASNTGAVDRENLV
jgi:hypothetical protein